MILAKLSVFRPVLEKKSTPIAWEDPSEYTMERVRRYNSMLKQVAKEKKVRFLDILETLFDIGVKKIIYDGIHPNPEGYKIIFQLVKEYLEENKLI